MKEFLKAAKIDWNATSFDVQDKRAEVILDAALSYAQLVNLSGKINTLLEAQKSAEKAQFVTEQRLNEGVDSKLDLTKANSRPRAFGCASPTRRASKTCCANISPS